MLDNHEIESVLEALVEGKTHEELDMAMTQIFEYYFIEKYAFSDIVNVGAEKDIRILLNTYPRKWANHYLENQYYVHDPIVLNSGKMKLPFSWEKRTLEKLTPIQKQIFNEASDYNIKCGTAIPLLPRSNGQCFLTILDHINIHPYITYVLTLASQMYYDRKRMIDANQHISTLTQREREILLMKSHGLSIKVVAHRLGVSDSTVVFHLRNIRQKLRATSLAHALFLFGLATAHTATVQPTKQVSRLERLSA